MSAPSLRRALAAAALSLTVALAAGCKKDEAAPAPGATPAASTPGATPAAPGAQAVAPPTAEALAPVIRELASEGVLPTQVVVEFSRAVRTDDDGEGPKAGTRLSFTPAVEGRLEYRGASTLVFTPRKPFAYDTEYRVQLEALELPSGTLKAPQGGWGHRFRTPAFGFVRAQVRSMDLRAGKAQVDLVFSGPTDAAAVRRVAAFTVDGQPAGAAFATTPERNVVTATLTGGRVRPGARVRVALSAGLQSAGATAPAAGGEVALPGGRRMDILAAYVQEGPSGYYVDVRCREVDADTPVRGEDDGEGEGEEGDDGEQRPSCTLDDGEAAQALRFNPAVKFSVTPGRNGFRIFGDFKRGTYALRIPAGTTSTGGASLYGTFEKTFSVSARQPQLSFATAGRYLPRSAWRSLPLNHLNLDRVTVSVRHVPPENLVFWMGNDDQETADERVANVVARKELALPAPPDTLQTTYVDVASLVPASTRGLVEVVAEQGGRRAASRVLLTELSLVAKRGGAPEGAKDAAGEVLVWALGIEDGEPLSGVEVTLVKKSGQVVARCTTKGEDGCRFTVPTSPVDPAQPFALVARKGDELTYLKYSELQTEIANSDVQGVPYRDAAAAYRAALWSDRGVYRPGDVAHVAALLRGQDDRAPQAGVPVELRVVDPRERVFKRAVVKTNEAGLVALDVPFEAYQDTGSYKVQLRVADRDVASYALNVEEFVPERMKVEARSEKAGYLAGEEAPVHVGAQYLFGGSADGSPVEVTCRLEPGAFKPKENAQYAYGVWRPQGSSGKPVTLGQVKAELDAKGEAVVRCPGRQQAGGFKGAGELVAQVSVFEAGSGRSTLGTARAAVHPEPYYLGLQAGVKKVKAGQPFEVQGIAVDWDGKLLADTRALKPVAVEYLRLEEEWGYTWDEGSGEERYQRYLRAVREGSGEAKLEGGRFKLTVTPSMDAAGYVVRVKSGAAQTDLQLEGSGYYYWGDGENGRVDQTPRPLKPTSLALELPARGRAGDEVQVKLKAPYKGRLLLTAETDRVLAAEWLEVQPGDVTWAFTPERFAPNVYVSAFLVKDPHLESKEAFLPDRAFGVASLPLEPTQYTQALTLNAPKEVRSNETLTVELDLGGKPAGPTYATVAVVDEGVLSLTRFKSPDPLAELFKKRALGVDTFETVGWTLLVPPQGNSRSTGGDGEGGDASGRVQPVKPVALWSGVVRVPDSGKLSLPFPLPQYRGQVRVMAVTAGPERVGRASAQVLVRDPLVLQTTLPRFLTMGDEVQVPVFVTNLTGKAADVKATLTAEPLRVPGMAPPPAEAQPLQLLGRSEGSVRLENGKSGTLVFQARATVAVGAARLKVTVSGGGFSSHEQLDVPFLPAGPRERRVQRIELAEGRTELAPYLEGWVPTTERSTLWVTTNPYADSFDHLKYLVQYPYGCIEQTTSSTRPLLYVSGLIDAVDPSLTAGGKLEDMVMSGVNRILSMQTPSGGFGYWPGATEPVEWGTAYATHMLLDAKAKGYAVPQDRLDDALGYLGREVGQSEGRKRDHYYSSNPEPYMHYVLALAGKGHKARVQKLIQNLADKRPSEAWAANEALEHEYMLKAALYLAGDRRYERDLKSPDVSAVSEVRRNDWSFYSDRRRRGFMLSTFQDLFGADPAGEPLAQRVAEALRGHSSGWYTTQELVWGVTGLGKRVENAASKFTPPTLTADGKVQQHKELKGRASDRTWALVRASERKGMALDVPQKGEGKLYLVLASEGVRQDASYRVGGEGLSVSRTYRTLSGEPVDTARGVKLADLVYVEVTVQNRTGERVQNLALVDRLPAGWEIENARLGRGGSVEWVRQDQLWEADYVNLRDDRVEVFGKLEAGEKRTVVYAVRAVTSGRFTLPPVEVEAMYDPRIWAREAGGTVEVSGPWKDFLL